MIIDDKKSYLIYDWWNISSELCKIKCNELFMTRRVCDGNGEDRTSSMAKSDLH